MGDSSGGVADGMHKVLERQVRRHFGGPEAVPAALRQFVACVDRSYKDADADRALVEHSLELMSKELGQRNEELRAWQREHKQIFDSVPALIIRKDAENRLLSINATAAAVMGSRPEDLEGKSTYDLMPPEVARALHEDDLQVIRSGKPKLGILESHPGAQGEIHWFRTDKVPYRDEDGRITGAIVLSVDITDRRKVEDQLREAYGRLEETDKARIQFINTAAHELGTPLTPIRLQVELVKGHIAARPDPAATKGVAILERNVARLQRLVKDLLDSARLQTGKLQLQLEPVDLGREAARACDAYRQAAKAAGVSLAAEAPPSAWVQGDASRIGQVLDNLLSNALKFTPAGGEVRIRVQPNGKEARLVVEDSGIGIAAESMPRLFRPFSQVHDLMQNTRPGTGLGLYISKGLVEAQGGHMGVESPGPGKGSAFWFALPMAAAATAATQLERAAAHAA